MKQVQVSNPKLAQTYSVSNATIHSIVTASGRWSYLGSPVVRPKGPKVHLNLAQKIHDEYFDTRGEVSQSDLANKYSISVSYLRKIVNKIGPYSILRIGSDHRKTVYLSKDEAQKIREIYATTDRSLTDLATQFNVSQATINIVVLAKGRYSYFKTAIKKQVQPSRPTALSMVSAAKLLRDYQSGEYKQKDLEKRYGVSKDVVHRVVYHKGPYKQVQSWIEKL